MVSCDLLSKPIEFGNTIPVLCIENKKVYRNIINSFIDLNTEDMNIVFSCDYEPLDSKKYVTFIYDYYKFDFSSSFIKKMYDDISLFCNAELQEKVINFRSLYITLLDDIIKEYDYDLEYNGEFSLPAIFKSCELKPSINSLSLIDNLLQYVLFLKKYSKIKCFVFANLHLHFTNEELKLFYSDLIYNHISAFVIENEKNFDSLDIENITIIDKDLCEIID